MYHRNEMGTSNSNPYPTTEAAVVANNNNNNSNILVQNPLASALL